MLSGNGRHRRPRQAPALLVAAGVTGSAIAIPLFAAGGASAADGTTWDKVAQCETGGSWSENSGSGFYGGLKLSQADWEKYGGLDYAPRADLASRNQQIAVAEKLLDAEGVGAFHTCGLTSGLSKDSGSADVDTGIGGGSSDSSDSSDGSDSTGLSNSSGNASSDPSGDSASSDASGSPSASPGSSSHSSGKSSKSDSSASPSTSTPSASQGADGSSAGRAKGDESDNSQQALGSWSLVDTGAVDFTATGGGTGKHRGASADESVDGGATKAAAHDSYTVRTGDTLASIADSLDVDGGWRAIYDANKQAIGTDPNHIFTGQTLDLPAE
ncbi:transglycosylase family protein [Streptomyces sp. MBT33]|uniref:LysM peptidoglycan-binding domain-containing protein n=1 Tax=Streptomyces sp. MBT33 TaxID=1488363 RepID=UPI00190BC542|nr:transglycosylase family protein [Streptomyces sp. MBT33]MBK3646126.1 LysM peptidoglycan-binding domain-containing protein [Streptomyces sp. MBT33]